MTVSHHGKDWSATGDRILHALSRPPGRRSGTDVAFFVAETTPLAAAVVETLCIPVIPWRLADCVSAAARRLAPAEMARARRMVAGAKRSPSRHIDIVQRIARAMFDACLAAAREYILEPLYDPGRDADLARIVGDLLGRSPGRARRV